jgi:hypothetical protein
MRHELPLPGNQQEGSAVSETTGQPMGGSTPAWNTVQNETAAKLIVPGQKDHELVLAPLERRRLRDDVCDTFRKGLKRLEELRYVSLWRDVPEAHSPALTFIGLGFWLVVLWLMGGIFFSSPLYWIGGLVGVAFIAVGSYFAYQDRTVIPLIVSLLLVLTIGVLGPATALYFGGDVHEAVDLVLDEENELAFLTLIGRGLQWTFIVVASVLPALLFFLFDRVKLVTLRQTFEREMLRFDPTVSTLSDVRARYGPRMDEVYGREPAREEGPISDDAEEISPESLAPRNGSRRVLPDRRGPVVMATIVITIGWVLALLNPDVKTPLANAQQIVLLFEPQRSPVVFAFLGAYVFALNAVLRSYVRSDLRPKSYTHIVVRIIVAVVFAWVLEALFFSTAQATTGQDLLLVLAFVVGLLPETLLVRLQEVARQFVGGLGVLPQLVERYPLTDLEGIDIYDRARLLDEGVGNIEGLAHHDLPALMMYTRIPAGRLVHWTDQAILFLHVAATAEASRTARQRLSVLKTYGIHTATDLQAAHAAARERAKKGADGEPKAGELDAFFFLLGAAPSPAPNGQSLSRIQVILDAIADEQWMSNLEYWHAGGHDKPITLRLDGKPGIVKRAEDPLALLRRVATADGDRANGDGTGPQKASPAVEPAAKPG